ncbi:hypothetical protein LFL97_32080 [Burkholderia sp. JSH-S8]|nr:hypothetical protein LFL97_32080 [Burkholderia sp. JSH-S8]
MIVTDQLLSYGVANSELGLNVEHRQHKRQNSPAENSHQLTNVRARVMWCFKSARQPQRFASIHGQVANLFMMYSDNRNARRKREVRARAFAA